MKQNESSKSMEYKGTPLHVAAIYNDETTIEFLCKNEADKEARDSIKLTPLHIAAYYGNNAAVETLCNYDANKEALDPYKYTPLHIAITKGHNTVVETLCKFGANIEAACEDDKFTPLYIAAKDGNDKIAKTLCAHKANIEIKCSPKKFTPLFIAALNGHDATVQVLCDYGANKEYLCAPDKLTALYIATQHGHKKVVETLCNCGANKNTLCGPKKNLTALFCAAKMGNAELVELLCKNKANTEVHCAKYESTPLFIGASEGYDNVVKILCNYGADKEAVCNIDNMTPLFIASLNGHDEAVKILCAHGAKINAKNIHDQTPLHIASQKDHTNIVKILCDTGANKNALDKFGLTPMMYAILSNNVKTAMMLVPNNMQDIVRLLKELIQIPFENNHKRKTTPKNPVIQKTSTAPAKDLNQLLAEFAQIDKKPKIQGQQPGHRQRRKKQRRRKKGKTPSQKANPQRKKTPATEKDNQPHNSQKANLSSGRFQPLVKGISNDTSSSSSTIATEKQKDSINVTSTTKKVDEEFLENESSEHVKVIYDKQNKMKLFIYKIAKIDKVDIPSIILPPLYTKTIHEWFRSKNSTNTNDFRIHCFSKLTDRFITEHGVQQYVSSRRVIGQNDICITLPGHVTYDEDPVPRRCLFVYLFDRSNGRCYHRNIEFKKDEGFIIEYLVNGKYQVELPPLKWALRTKK